MTDRMYWRRLQWAIIGACLLGWMASGCANPVAAARGAVATAAKVQTEGVAAFVAFDAQHQKALVDAAATKDAAQAALKSYRADRAKVVTAINAVWLATVATETAANLAEAGLKDKNSLVGYVTALLKTVGELSDALRVLGVPIPNLGVL